MNVVGTGSRTPGNSGGIHSSHQAGLVVSAWEIDFFGRIASVLRSSTRWARWVP